MKHLRVGLSLLLLVLSLTASSQVAENDSLLTIVRQDRRDKAEAMALISLAFYYTRTDMRRAIGYLHEAIAVAAASNIIPQLSNAYADLVIDEHDIGAKDSALFYLDKLRKLAEAYPNLRPSYTSAAGMYYKREQDFKAALPFLLETVALAEKEARADSSVTHLTNLAGTNLNVGNTVTEMGDFKTAQRYQLKALDLFEKVDNKRGISYCYQMLGNNFLELHRYQEARDYTRKALEIKTAQKDTRGIGTADEQLANIFKLTRLYDSALKYYQLTLAIDQRLGLKLEETTLDLEIGQAYKARQNDSAARRYFEQGKALASAAGDSARVASFDAALISMRKNMEDPLLAEQQLLNTLYKEMQTGDITSLQTTYQFLADHYANTGQTRKAFDYLKKYYDLNDSLLDVNIQVQLRKMEGQYNVGKKEQEIALLKKDQQLTHANLEKQKAMVEVQNAVLAKNKLFQYSAVVLFCLLLLIGFLILNRYRIVHRVRRAMELEKMRNHIARDLHDDIGSTLSSINIASKIALESPSADGSRNSLEKIMERSADIMEKMDDIVWTINPLNDTMEQLLYRMKEFAAEMLEPLSINFSFEEQGDLSTMKLDIRKRKDLYLVFKEAINNAAKYSECRNLLIRLHRVGEYLKLEITDDGKGFAAETIRNGNGLNNMRERAASMVASLRINSSVGEGTRIGLDLPLT